MDLKGLTVEPPNDPNPSNLCMQFTYFLVNKKAYATKKKPAMKIMHWVTYIRTSLKKKINAFIKPLI